MSGRPVNPDQLLFFPKLPLTYSTHCLLTSSIPQKHTEAAFHSTSITRLTVTPLTFSSTLFLSEVQMGTQSAHLRREEPK